MTDSKIEFATKLIGKVIGAFFVVIVFMSPQGSTADSINCVIMMLMALWFNNLFDF